MYTEAEMDALARQGAETLCFKPGVPSEYDVEHYRRIPRKSTPYGQHPYYEIPPASSPPISVPDHCVGDRPYLIRLGGFRRGSLFGPDEIGQVFSGAGVRYADGIGNGLFESLLLCRKYGIWPTSEAPTTGFEYPFLKEDFEGFRAFYHRKVAAMRSDLRLAEQIFGQEIIGRRNQPWVLWLRLSPFALYLESLGRNPEGVGDEMETAIGIRKAPIEATTVDERAALVRFWTYIRTRHGEVLAEMGRIFREEIVGEGLVTGNMHANPIVAYPHLGEIFDLPGLAVRPGYLEDRYLYSSYIAFTIWLFRDLTGKPPVVSVRSNLLASGIRFIPGPNALRHWYSVAVRSGAGGFYFWPSDYPSDAGSEGYDGPMYGNPDPSARGRERWQAHLEILSGLGFVRTFVPPEPEVALLESWEGLDSQGWEKAFTAFHLFESARVRTKFVDISAAEKGTCDLRSYKLVVVPSLPICSSESVEKLARYLEAGGMVVAGENGIGGTDLQGRPVDVDLDWRKLSDESEELQSISGGSRGAAWVEPAVAGEDAATTSPEKVRDVSARLKALCEMLSVDSQKWVYGITVDNVGDATGALPGYGAAPTSSDTTIEHYLYEHSSDWILPEYEKRGEDRFGRD